FGASAGGPIEKNRVFFFGFYEGYRNRQGATSNIVVLTDAQRTGDFSGGAAIRDPLTGQPFPNNVIPQARLDPAAVKLVNDFVPRANSAGNRYVVSPSTTDDRDSLGVRVDYQLSQRNTILGRYLRTRTDRIMPPITTPSAQEAKATLQDFMLSDTHLF